MANLSPMTLSSRLTTAPLPLDPDLATEVAFGTGRLRDLVEGMAGSSSYLRSLLQREGEWLQGAAGQEPEAAFDAILAELTPEMDNLPSQLRKAKRRVALLLAACDLGGVWPLLEITGRLSRFADLTVELALQAEVARAHGRNKLPKVLQDRPCAGIVALAMGKMGAGELNYSSDIDLIMLFDDSVVPAADYDETRAMFQRITRDMARTLSDQTAEGYVFRTDLRLRPNPAVTPVCVPMEAAERYYESEGRTWERAAFIKARAAAGDVRAGQGFLESISPFVWRRHLDFAAIQDAHDMRLRIREHKGLAGAITVPGHDMKLGRGGIREIEFFAQTQQLIAGGRDDTLRVPGTIPALAALAEKDWIPESVARRLTDAYTAHRTAEHRIQMLRDAQTHQMPGNGEALDQVARLSGWADTGAFVEDQRSRLEEVHALIEGFFAPSRARADAPDLPESMVETMESWGGLPALRSRRAMEIFERLRPEITRRIAQAAQPEATLRQLDGFIRSLPAGVQLFSLFEANPQILDLLMDICGTAPGLASYLSENTGVLDAVIGGAFFDPLPDVDGYCAGLAQELEGAEDYEDALVVARRWQKEQHFRIGVLLLRRLAELEEVEAAYSDLAEAVLRGLLPFVEAEVARRYGTFDAQSVAILGMGKLGSRQMTAASDLDLIVIYEVEGDMASGRQGFAPTQYFSRLTQVLITALSSPMADGMLYEVDMRLRPSGRQGPVAVSVVGFEDYQKTKAWTWEHLALTRARVVAGGDGLTARLEAIRAEILSLPRDADKLREDVCDMRARIAAAKGVGGVWEVKDQAGGLLDVELIAQMAALLRGTDAQDPRAQLAAGGLPAGDAGVFAATHRLLCAVQQAQRLLMEGKFDPEKLGPAGLGFVAAFAGFDGPDDVRRAISEAMADCATRIGRNLSPE